MDKASIETFGPVVHLDRNGFLYCTRGRIDLALNERVYEIRTGDIYIYPPFSHTYIHEISDDLQCVVGVADFDFVLPGHQSGLQCAEPGLHPRKPLHLARREAAGPDRGADRRRPQPGGRGRRIYRCGARRYGLSAVALGAGAGGLLRNHAGLFLEPADPPAAAGAQGPDFPAVPHLAPPELPGAPRSGLLRRAAVSDAALLLDGRAREDGPPALRWITATVVAEAKKMLSDPALSVKEIADALGFPNQSFFGRYFRQYTGISPTEFRSGGPKQGSEAVSA